ncbi:MCE family protein [Nocardioides sp. zg-536]|uniref:MCE family protein n=1 Tax=Nocardioides faecalis TaxID=2803858 RepID=A0A938Y7J4_9ACTN|nr:MlaD family protein [Nocardioides faecalis]MBM9459300.1 MCE family protein [Nocardioides faecalis]MBS4751539.1 MCE family protein [Nocardioides faecalis]QVI59576.1 MCE family protein [Nocardioides faecalis]
MSRQLSELRRHRGAVLGVVVFALVGALLTSMVAGTLSRSQRGDTITLTGVFRDATGLRAGDDVRVAGVRVGRVAETRVGTGEERGLAVVTMSVEATQPLHTDVVASIDYLNLMGQRYVDLSRPDREAQAPRLRDGHRIPLERTRPALDLSAMFNAFKPVFDLLQPGDVNELAGNIVAALQGQGPTLDHLLAQTAELTAGLSDREETLARVADDVTLVLQTTDEHREEVTSLVTGLDSLTRGLARDRDRIATSLDSIARLSATTAGLVEQAGPAVRDVTTLSRDWFDYLAERKQLLADTGASLPRQLEVYLRTLGYGSYLNVYVCTLSAGLSGVPNSIDLGVTGDQHSRRCR